MKAQLSRQDWLEFGLKTLVTSGAGALKAEPMAKALNVSRGSFYWHFTDIDAFRSGVLELWRDRSTTRIITEIDGEGETTGRLSALLRNAFMSDPSMERAIRAWSLQDGKVAEAVAKVDEERIGYLVKLLVGAGLARTDALDRAKLMYCAYVGKTVLSGDTGSAFGIDIERMEELLS
ncbi:MAG: TetR/AcrR family transcriptional regulator [Hyphomicrobiales bacterium]